MPCASPPWTWPSTIIGLMMFPKSSAATKLHDFRLAPYRDRPHLADVAAGREGEVGRIVERALLQPRLHAFRQIVGGYRRERHLEPRHRLVGAGDLALAILDDDVALVGFQSEWAAIFLALGLDLVERLDDGRHAHGAGARAVGAHAHLHLVGIAVDDVDRVETDAEAVRRQAGAKGGLVSLAVAVQSPSGPRPCRRH